jgi:hypothetical protein
METSALLVLPPLVAGVLSLLAGLGTLIVTVAAIRVFASEETEALPREYFTHNMGWAVLNFLVGAVVFGVAVALGLVALVVPGIFLLVALAFWSVFVALEDQNFLEGFRSSWGLTRGHRLDLLALGVAVVFVSILVEVAFGIGGALSGAIGEFVLAQAASALVTVFSTAALAIAYTELTALPDAGDGLSVEEQPASPRTGTESI